MTTNGLLYEFWSAARQGPRMYFAPLVGAIRAVRDEIATAGLNRSTVKTGVDVSVLPVRKRKR